MFYTNEPQGSMDPRPTLKSLGLPLESSPKSQEEARPTFMEAVSKLDSDELQHLASDTYRQAGTICWTTDEYQQSEHGKANAHVGLFEVHSHPETDQKPCWWPDDVKTSLARPLAGLKVVDLTRAIAGPATTRGLAEYGASVMRITGPAHLPDISLVHVDLNQGKWTATLDLTEEAGRAKLRGLILEADVVMQGYRPGVFEKYGFGQEDILAMAKERGRGIIYARENCYGHQGPWAYRSGWQQISDAVI